MRARALAAVVVLLTVAACGGAGKAAPSTAPGSSPATSAAASCSPTSACPATTQGAGSGGAAKASGVIAGKPFAAGTQFVQFETTESIWRLHLLGPGHSCNDELASVKPAVGIDFDTGGADKVPAVGAQTSGVGVVFVPADRPDIGAFTANSGVTLTFTKVDATPGGRWQGHVSVEKVTEGSDTYSFDGDIDALVCPAGQL